MENAMNLTRNIYFKKKKWSLLFNKKYNNLIKPSWMVSTNDTRYNATYSDQQILFNDGKIVLGKIVQANSLLFQPGKYDSPANLIFSDDPFFEQNPDKLESIASNLYKIKGIETDNVELQKFSDILFDEYVTLFNEKVPTQITYGKTVYFTSIVVTRKHLPSGYIKGASFFPILMNIDKTEASIILPSKYWSNEFKAFDSNQSIL